ncbi:MAG: hypothetical protein R3B94_09280 [Hyphomonas sp.]
MGKTIDLPISVTGVEDTAFPVWLRFELVDRHGVRHEFIKKAPVLFEGAVPISFPFPATIACEVLERHETYSLVTTDRPLGLSSVNGDVEFECG